MVLGLVLGSIGATKTYYNLLNKGNKLLPYTPLYSVAKFCSLVFNAFIVGIVEYIVLNFYIIVLAFFLLEHV